MIHEINPDKVDEIKPMIDLFRERSDEGVVPEDFHNQIKDSVSNNRASAFGNFTEDGVLNGIGLFGKVSHRISFVFADGNLEIETKIVSVLLDKFSKEYQFITTGGPWISDMLSEHIIEIGFTKHDRSYMTLPRNEVESLPEPALPDGMRFEPFSSSSRDEIAELMFKCNDGHVDQDVFPDFFGTPESCGRLIENIEANRYGVYTEGLSWILHNGAAAIGACFMTCRNGDTSYIPDIVIDHGYRGKGLGKAILVHSMKRQLESDSAIVKVDLDVTLSNNARYLYESLGFKDVREHSMYIWKR